MSDLAHYRTDAPRRPTRRRGAPCASCCSRRRSACCWRCSPRRCSATGSTARRPSSLVAGEQSRIAILEGSALADFVAAGSRPTRRTRRRCKARCSTGWSARPTTTRSGSCASAARSCSPRRTPPSAQASLPRRLTRDEKWLFDLGQELRAAADTNQAEGVFRKPQIDVSRVGTGPHPGHGALPRRRARSRASCSTSGPLESVAPARAPLPWPLLVVLPLALLWLVALRAQPLRRRCHRRHALDPVPRRARLVLGGLVPLLEPRRGRRSRASPATATPSVAAAYNELRARVAGDAAGRATGGDGAANPWDVDVFQRPRGLLGGRRRHECRRDAQAALETFSRPFVRVAVGQLGARAR